MLQVRDAEERLQPPQDPVAAPVLGQLDGSARQVAGMALEFLLEFLEQRRSASATEPAKPASTRRP